MILARPAYQMFFVCIAMTLEELNSVPNVGQAHSEHLKVVPPAILNAKNAEDLSISIVFLAMMGLRFGLATVLRHVEMERTMESINVMTATLMMAMGKHLLISLQ
jgi:hypothetical protein